MMTNKIAYFDPEIGEFVYEWRELPLDWDITDEERWALYDEAMGNIGWSDCR